MLPHASATSASVVISHIIAGETGAATSELVALYNNNMQDLNLTGYCLKNKSAVTFACISAPANTKVFIRAHQYLTIASSVYVANHPAYQPDTIYAVTNQSSGSIVAGGDVIRITDTTGQEIDSVSWTTALAAGNAWRRSETNPGSGVLIDTDSMADFVVDTHPDIPVNTSYDVETIIDICPNINDAQVSVPTGMIIDVHGDCIVPPLVDVCPNIDGVQTQLPAGYMTNDVGECRQDVCSNIDGLQVDVPYLYDMKDGVCAPHDVCANLPDIQSVMPNGYKQQGQDCVLDLLPLQLTELLPNVAGSDSGHEYIEIYNPTDKTANLGLYTLYVGVNNEKSYPFPTGSTIGPGQYIVFHDTDLKFTLANTAGRVGLAGNDGTIISQSDAYANPADDEAWALIDGQWQYTDQPTPGALNAVSKIAKEGSVQSSPLPCPEGKYRNSLTGRCRNIEADAATLAACSDGQYRNPETGRCRKIVTTGFLTPCKDGQYRSEETNRCRNISTASAGLAPCKEGQERNPDTNRCRNATSSSMPAAGFAVEPVKQGTKTFVGWWTLAIVATLALAYAVWEWRYELRGNLRKIYSLIKIK